MTYLKLRSKSRLGPRRDRNSSPAAAAGLDPATLGVNLPSCLGRAEDAQAILREHIRRAISTFGH